ncbi:MAG: phage baseplate assembly protein V [Pricia sp.]
MSKIVTPKLILNGEDFLPKHGYKVTVEQSIGGQSTFSICFMASATETYAGAMMENAIKFIGKRMYIALDDAAMEFTGLVTSVDLQKGSGAGGTLVVSGHGPSVLLANSVQCLSFEEGTPLSHVAFQTLEGHSTELLKAKMGTGTNIALPYTVQYNESDLAFLQRLCRKYGLWFYHNGREYCIGRSGSAQIEATYGVDVSAFILSTNLRGGGPEVSGHDWMGDSLLESPSELANPQSGHPYFRQVKQESNLNFAKPGRYDHTSGQHEFSRQGGMDRAMEVTALGRASSMVTATGTSEIVALRVADILALEGLNFSDSSDRHVMGHYDIVKITHSFDHSGHYQNRFEAIPADMPHPPYSDGFAVPFAPDQRGRVIDNADPEGLGRVKVQFPWQIEITGSTPWIKTSTPYGGSGKGFYFVPEKGEEVLVGFEGGNPEKPYVIGGGYNHKAKSGFGDSQNNIKAIRTRSGHLIELNDKDGAESITIKDKNENLFSIDTASNDITISAKRNLTLNAEEYVTINAKNVAINAEENIQQSAEKNIQLAAQEENILFSASKKIELQADNIISEATHTNKITGKDLLHIADGDLTLEGGSKASLKASKTEIAGSQNTMELP